MSYGPGGYGPPPPQGPPPPGYGGPGGMGGPPPPPPPPPPGGGYGGEAPINKASPIILIVLGVLCCNCISLVLGIVSLTMAESNPKAAKTCALIGWILVALGIVVNIALFALGVFDAMLTPTGSYDTTY